MFRAILGAERYPFLLRFGNSIVKPDQHQRRQDGDSGGANK